MNKKFEIAALIGVSSILVGAIIIKRRKNCKCKHSPSQVKQEKVSCCWCDLCDPLVDCCLTINCCAKEPSPKNTEKGSIQTTQTSETQTALELTYKTKLPEVMIEFSSAEGKKIFIEALSQGNLESYFTLSEQLITQPDLTSCGTSSLTMVLNTLQIDPGKQWKGVWRWYTETQLHCVNKDHMSQGLMLHQFVTIANCNKTKIQAFYHCADKTRFNVLRAKQPYDQIFTYVQGKYKEGHCSCGPNRIFIKSSSYQTFIANLVACSRRTGIYPVVNFSRRALSQNGEGHYNPISATVFKDNKWYVLFLDLAKFKYPAYWCEAQQLFDSMQLIDSDSGMPRGYTLITADLKRAETARKVTPDETSQKNFKAQIEVLQNEIIKFTEQRNIISLIGQKDLIFLIISNLGRDFNYILAYYLYDLSIRIESKFPNPLTEALEKLEETSVAKSIRECLQENFQRLCEYDIFWILNDYQPTYAVGVLTLVFYALEKVFKQTNMIKTEDIFEEKSELNEVLVSELRKLEYELGLNVL